MNIFNLNFWLVLATAAAVLYIWKPELSTWRSWRFWQRGAQPLAMNELPTSDPNDAAKNPFVGKHWINHKKGAPRRKSR